MNQNSNPIILKKLSIKKSVFFHVDVIAGLDRGCSLTKIIYLDKNDLNTFNKDDNDDNNNNVDEIVLTAVLFHNSKFEDAIYWLKEKAVFPENKDLPIHTTGIGGIKYIEIIKEILERDVVFVDEFLSQSRGAYHFIKYIPLNEVIHPEIKITNQLPFNLPFNNNIKEIFEEIVGKQEKKVTTDLLPCIFGFMGSACGFTYIGVDGKFSMAAGPMAGGKTFIGLCRCLLGTTDYTEIMSMAARGDRRNIDSQLKDFVDENYSFENNTNEFPIIFLGKLAQTKKSINEFNKDDIAHSIVSMTMYNSLVTAVYTAISVKVQNVFFGGNLFQSEIFRKEFYILKEIMSIDFMNFYFVSNGNTAALGAMISSTNDLKKYFQVI